MNTVSTKSIKLYLKYQGSVFSNRNIVSRPGVRMNLALKECSSDSLFPVDKVCPSSPERFKNGLLFMLEISLERFSLIQCESKVWGALDGSIIQMQLFNLNNAPLVGLSACMHVCVYIYM